MKHLIERLRRPSATVPNGASPPYRVFTRDFDHEVSAADLDTIIGALSPRDAHALEEAWTAFQGALIGWRTRAHVRALQASEAVRRSTSDEGRQATVVSILVDQSGSMRGQSTLLTAAAIDVAQDFLVHLGCKVEILGFTTASWHGGQARRRWIRRLRPRAPGRLCELLHIVYKSAEDMRTSTMSPLLRPMLRPDLPKENVDGEALEWAAARLADRPETRRAIVVISDGAPVDDSTLAANDPDILDRHLRMVIGEIEEQATVEVAAVGIGFDVSRYYSRNGIVNTADDLGTALIDLLGQLLCSSGPRPAERATEAPSALAPQAQAGSSSL